MVKKYIVSSAKIFILYLLFYLTRTIWCQHIEPYKQKTLFHTMLKRIDIGLINFGTESKSFRCGCMKHTIYWAVYCLCKPLSSKVFSMKRKHKRLIKSQPQTNIRFYWIFRKFFLVFLLLIFSVRIKNF